MSTHSQSIFHTKLIFLFFKFLANTTHSDIGILIQNVKEEIKSIVNKSTNANLSTETTDNQLKLPDEFSALIAEFNLFNQTLNQILNNGMKNKFRSHKKNKFYIYV